MMTPGNFWQITYVSRFTSEFPDIMSTHSFVLILAFFLWVFNLMCSPSVWLCPDIGTVYFYKIVVIVQQTKATGSICCVMLVTLLLCCRHTGYSGQDNWRRTFPAPGTGVHLVRNGEPAEWDRRVWHREETYTGWHAAWSALSPGPLWLHPF